LTLKAIGKRIHIGGLVTVKSEASAPELSLFSGVLGRESARTALAQAPFSKGFPKKSSGGFGLYQRVPGRIGHLILSGGAHFYPDAALVDFPCSSCPTCNNHTLKPEALGINILKFLIFPQWRRLGRLFGNLRVCYRNAEQSFHVDCPTVELTPSRARKAAWQQHRMCVAIEAKSLVEHSHQAAIAPRTLRRFGSFEFEVVTISLH
jgi:hypothetical protein